MGNSNNISIKIGNMSRNITSPESWASLDLRTLSLFYNTLFTTACSEFTSTAFTMVKLITMAQHLLRIDSTVLAKWEDDCLKQDTEHGDVIFLEELREVLHAVLSGLFEIEKDEEIGVTTYAAKLNLNKNPYPQLTHTQKATTSRKPRKTVWFYAPEDSLSNISIYELAYTFTLFENYLANENDQVADRLIATLYRPSRPQTKLEVESGWGGDRRQPLRKYETKIEERANLVSTLPALTKRLILFWFASCRQGIIKQYAKVFRKSEDLQAEKSNYGWGGVLLALAGGPVGLDAIADQKYSNALTWLSMKEDERQEQERALERLKKR